ncbi:MAG: thioredoxin-disulfide reductase [candidate division Zixibacteria bacterium]|nr:thioredoxin-disulfide reductase [Candidatus Tariuqbacter arcticus]
MDIRKVVILGSGPAGYTAAIYTSRANLNPLLFEGSEPGGQLTITTEVENYPGFAEGITGPELMNIFKLQAERFGTEIIPERVVEVDLSKRPFYVKGDNSEFKAKTLIISTGATALWLGIPSEDKLRGYGVSACATCDGFFFQNKKVLVIGGGDTAMEEAVFLTRFASEVRVIHRRDALRASKIMQEKAFTNEKISFIWDSVVEEVLGERETGVQGVRYKNVKTGELTNELFDGVFLAIGYVPNTEIFKGQLDMDENGYIITRPGSASTSVKGVFAAGDVQDRVYRQAITAAGTGCMAALEAERFLGE